jgi:hypothetical protein
MLSLFDIRRSEYDVYFLIHSAHAILTTLIFISITRAPHLSAAGFILAILLRCCMPPLEQSLAARSTFLIDLEFTISTFFDVLSSQTATSYVASIQEGPRPTAFSKTFLETTKPS